jgi:glutathione S-transferase
MDSRKIADALESRYPSPLLHLDFPKLANVQATVIKANVATAPLWCARIPRNILNERSVSYFSETRVKWFGMTLDELEKSDKGGEGAWEAALPHLQELAQMLKEKGGPYFMGKIVSYADFIVAAFFQFWKQVAPDLFERLVKVDEAFPNLYESCEEWLKRDDR